MRIKTQHSPGIVLIEMILVLAIASTIILMGLRVYNFFRADQQLNQLSYNVDLIFQSVSKFYHANCRGFSGNNDGVLNPSQNPTSPYVVLNNTVSTLISQSYLDSTQLIPSLLLDTANTGTTNQGYFAQLNLLNATDRQYYWCMTNPTTQVYTCSTPSSGATTNTGIGNVQVWQAQVAIKVADYNTALIYQQKLGADCVSTLATNSSGTGTYIVPCSTSTSSSTSSSSSSSTNNLPTYVVWTRIPSLASPQTNSLLSLSLFGAKTFNLQYTNDGMAGFNATYWQGSLTTPPISYDTTYYLCGG